MQVKVKFCIVLTFICEKFSLFDSFQTDRLTDGQSERDYLDYPGVDWPLYASQSYSSVLFYFSSVRNFLD